MQHFETRDLLEHAAIAGDHGSSFVARGAPDEEVDGRYGPATPFLLGEQKACYARCCRFDPAG